MNNTPDPRRKKPRDYYALAASRGYLWLGPEAPNTKTKTYWKCHNGHKWQATYGSLIKAGCPKCADEHRATKRRKNQADYRAIAKEKGIEWLGPIVPNTRTRTWWRCANGHKWETTFASLSVNQGCPACARSRIQLALRLEPENYFQLADERNYEWLGPVVSNAQTSTNWRCHCGYEWTARYNDLQQGKGCPACSRERVKEKLRHPPQKYYELAALHRIMWLGPEVENNQIATRWRCSAGHEWRSAYNNLLRRDDPLCPICKHYINGKKTSRQQREIAAWLDGDLNLRVGDNYIDIALLDEMIAIEYDGWVWHKDKLDYDHERDQQLIRQGWNILHIRSGELLPSIEALETALNQLRSGARRIEIILDDWGDD